jgi:hypothetical protein
LEYNLILIKLEGDFLKIGDSSEMVGLILYVFNVAQRAMHWACCFTLSTLGQQERGERNWLEPSFCNENNIKKNSRQFGNQTKRLNTYAKKIIIGPPLITSLAFMNHYWFDTSNGSCVSMYPQFH